MPPARVSDHRQRASRQSSAPDGQEALRARRARTHGRARTHVVLRSAPRLFAKAWPVRKLGACATSALQTPETDARSRMRNRGCVVRRKFRTRGRTIYLQQRSAHMVDNPSAEVHMCTIRLALGGASRTLCEVCGLHSATRKVTIKGEEDDEASKLPSSCDAPSGLQRAGERDSAPNAMQRMLRNAVRNPRV